MFNFQRTQRDHPIFLMANSEVEFPKINFLWLNFRFAKNEMPIMKFSLLICAGIIFINFNLAAQEMPKGFTYLDTLEPSISFEMRYYSSRNFVGDTIDGYLAARCIITENAALAIQKIQKELNNRGYGLKIYDAYRPQTAVDHFVRWAQDLNDTIMKSQHYPEVKKSELFKEGYISDRSGHSRGSSIDLTLIYTEGENKGKELDMGTPWDFFSKKSWPNSDEVSSDERRNRMILQQVMLKYGFRPLKEEWWHFTFKDEAFPYTYFDFPVK